MTKFNCYFKLELNKIFNAQNVAFSAWRNSSLYQIMFAGGTIVNVWLNKVGDLERITFDKVPFETSKLSDTLSEIII